MFKAMPSYSTLFQCLYDQECNVVPHFPSYSVFRAIDSRDVTQQAAALPRVHDFAVIWDDDRDTRIIPVIEEMLMAGILAGVQFIGEHKGTLTIILAARTYWKIDVEMFKQQVASLTQAAGDIWAVEVGQFDNSRGSLRTGHQCDFKEIIALDDPAVHAFLLTIDAMWKLGTKQWHSFEKSKSGDPGYDRYVVYAQPGRRDMALGR